MSEQQSHNGSAVRGFAGMAVAALTPFNENGSCASELIPPYAEFLLAGGADALMVGGTTGEFVVMTEDERRTVLSDFVAAVDGRVPIIAHVGHADIAAAKRLTSRAGELGVAAVAAILPYFHPTTNSAVRDSLAELAAAQSDVPFLAYLHPATGNSLTAGELSELLDAQTHVVGAKLSLATWTDLEPFLTLLDRAVLFCGNDVLLPDFVRAGGRASVTGNGAVYPEAVGAALRALLGEDATAWSEFGPLLDEIVGLTVGGAPDRLKQLLRERGGDAGYPRVRTGAPESTDARASAELLAIGR